MAKRSLPSELLVENDRTAIKVPRNATSNDVFSEETISEVEDDKPLVKVGDMQKEIMKNFYDVDIFVGNVGHPAHKLILAAASTVLAEKLSTGLERHRKKASSSESAVRMDKLRLNDISEKCWAATRDYIYKNKIVIPNVEFALQLLKCGKQYALQPLIVEVRTFLSENMNHQNCHDIFQKCHEHKIDDLKSQARREMMSWELKEISKPRVFAKFDVALIEELLNVPNARVRSELDVFDFLVAWLTNGKTVIEGERKPSAQGLLDNIDLYKMNNYELAQLQSYAQVVGLTEYASKVHQKWLDGPEFSSPLSPSYRLVWPRSSKTLTFTHNITGISELDTLYEPNHEFVSNWHRDDNGYHWHLRVTQEESAGNKFLGVFLARAPKKKGVDVSPVKVTFQAFVVKREKYEAGEVSKRENAEFGKESKDNPGGNIQGWKEFLALGEILKEGNELVDEKSDSITLGTTIYFD